MSLAFLESPSRPRADAESNPAAPLTALLHQLQDVVTLLPPSVYLARPAARVSGSVGEHVRHTVDHVSALIAAVSGGDLSYDSRLRGTTIEVNPNSAVDEIQRLLFKLEALRAPVWDRAVSFPTLLEANQPEILVRTTLRRELAFVVQHTIHHCALIAVLLEWQGLRVPPGFGIAPSTTRAGSGPAAPTHPREARLALAR